MMVLVMERPKISRAMATASHRPTVAILSGKLSAASGVEVHLHPGRLFLDAVEDVHRAADGRIDAEHAVGRVDVGHLADFAIVKAKEAGHRRAASLEAE
jgi:hypothetical protein